MKQTLQILSEVRWAFLPISFLFGIQRKEQHVLSKKKEKSNTVICNNFWLTPSNKSMC